MVKAQRETRADNPGKVFKRRCSVQLAAIALVSFATVAIIGCDPSMSGVDKRVNALMQQTTDQLGGDAYAPTSDQSKSDDGANPNDNVSALPDPNVDYASETLQTINPASTDLRYVPKDEADDLISRLEAYSEIPENALPMDLVVAMIWALDSSREYKFAEEEYVLAALRLLIERHRWGPRFFDEISTELVGSGDDGTYDTSLELVNELGVTQKLPYGGEIGARAIARATEDLRDRVAGGDFQSAELILDADIPLLRGAGIVAREPRIQAEREVIYAARAFENFRRDFLFSIAVDFLDLSVSVQSIANAERQVEALERLQERARTLFSEGRSTRFEAALAENATYSAIDRLNSQREQFRLDLDRFKLRLGMPIDQAVRVIPVHLGLPPPSIDINEAVLRGLMYRLDLQTQRDRIDDATRGLANARNGLLPDLDLAGSLNFATDPDDDHPGLRYDWDSPDFRAGVTFGLPLDREIERLNVRQAQIDLERSTRDYEEFRDNVAINVRSAVRGIDRARFSLDIQERNIGIAEQRLKSIQADPDRATTRDFTEATNDLLDARDARDAARRDLDVAIMRYLLNSGQLRVNQRGQIQPLPGMEINYQPIDQTENSDVLYGPGEQKPAPETAPELSVPDPIADDAADD